MIDRLIAIIGPTFAIALVGFASLADDAYAATGTAPSDHYFPWKPLAAWVLLAMFIGWLWSILKRSIEPVREDDDDPYRHAPRETDEDRFRRAYAESDGDHAGYVDYRRGKK